MRLHLNHLNSGSAAETASASAITAGKSSSAASRTSAGSLDTVSLSGPTAILAQASADREMRVQQLTAAYQSGNYQVSSAAISQSLVSSAIA